MWKPRCNWARVHGPTGATGTSRPAGPPEQPALPGPRDNRRNRSGGSELAGNLDWRQLYAVNDAVAYNGSSYIGIQAGASQQPDTSTALLDILLAQVGLPERPAPRVPSGPPGHGSTGSAGSTGAPERPDRRGVGPTGATGPAGLNWRGTWDMLTVYAVNDEVVTTVPATSPFRRAVSGARYQPPFWTSLAQAGSAGATGATGPAGPRGHGSLPARPDPPGNGRDGTPGPAGATGPQGLTGREPGAPQPPMR